MRNLSDSVACVGLSVVADWAARRRLPASRSALSIASQYDLQQFWRARSWRLLFGVLFLLSVLALSMPPAAVFAETDQDGEAASEEQPIEIQEVAPTRAIGNVGVRYAVKGDTLLDIARDNRLGILELMAANPDKDPWVPGVGSLIILPTYRILPDAPEKGIVINLAERRLYYFDDPSGEVLSLPIGIGREGFTTPLGSTKIVRKKADPIWYPTAATRADSPELPEVVPPGPENPMGEYALYLGWPTYAIHGTNRPWGVGRQVSRGCIRLYPEDIEFLFGQAPVGTKVTVVNQPVKFAWQNDRLFMEIQPSRDQLDALEQNGRFEPESFPGLLEMAEAAFGDGPGRLDLAAIAHAERERRGVPVIISVP